ncbi:MAG: hypothetical protein K5829_07060 [Treponema sp.]|nr:hypothetical protein [Treponema sp.]
MLKKRINKLAISTLLFFTISNFLFGQKLVIDYYGITSTQLDANIAKMTSDLYFTQLSEIQNFSVNDKRSDEANFSKDNFADDTISFYVMVTQDEVSSKWIITYNIVNKLLKTEYSESKKFDSFYKILMEPKNDLQSSLKKLFNHTDETNTTNTKSLVLSSPSKSISTDELSGTWEGEDFIDKIVIMRGGRGFVIFNNGASMNISVNIIDNKAGLKVKIVQKSRSNASFFPELSRQVAIKEAINADPITWELSLTDENTLSGIKNTLFETDNNVSKKSINVTWKRKI